MAVDALTELVIDRPREQVAAWAHRKDLAPLQTILEGHPTNG